jgi:hypothetical protein
MGEFRRLNYGSIATSRLFGKCALDEREKSRAATHDAAAIGVGVDVVEGAGRGVAGARIVW